MPNTKNTDRLRQLPAVDALLNQASDMIAQYGRERVTEVIRMVLEDARQLLLAGQENVPEIETLLRRVSSDLSVQFQPTLRPVINATGVIVHTNLGRAPLSLAAQQAVERIATSYSTLEFDTDSGKRGSRLIHAESLLTRLTGAEAALVVNNNAAATVLMLAALASGREVIVSRGQLVEIGGGFRIPDIMAQSGATLVEVGTTNRTRAVDYEGAINEQTALLMRVHASNFKQIGFTEDASLVQLAAIAHAHHLYLVDDLGSGALVDTSEFGLEHEPMPQESLAAGADLVCFSGDKLLGGPQAGILVGRRSIVDSLKRHPLARAFRADKLCLAALTATLEHYLKGEAVAEVPVLKMIARTPEKLETTAERWATIVGGAAMLVTGESTVGGGSLPGATLPTTLLAFTPQQPDAFAAALRAAVPPVIARIAQDRVLLDPRTVLPEQESALLAILKSIAHQTTFVMETGDL